MIITARHAGMEAGGRQTHLLFGELTSPPTGHTPLVTLWLACCTTRVAHYHRVYIYIESAPSEPHCPSPVHELR